MRYAFVSQLFEEAQKDSAIMLLTGDLGFTVFEEFRDKLPDQFINVGVSEQNMMGAAAGLALTGKKVVVYSIATFATLRAYEHIRDDIALHNLPVIVVGTGSGLSYGHLGPSHHSIEDIAIARMLPNMTIFGPGDPYEARWATKKALSLKSPVYLRLGKAGEPDLSDTGEKLTMKKGRILTSGGDVLILSTGAVTKNALDAVSKLKKRNISATLISMHTIQPIGSEFLRLLLKQFKTIVTVEEHLISGGLGSIVAEQITSFDFQCRLLRLGIKNHFIDEVGSQDYLRKKAGIDSMGIFQSVESFVRRNT